MTNNKFNTQFLKEVIKPFSEKYINNGYVDRDAIKMVYQEYKTRALKANVITSAQHEKFILTNAEMQKSHIQ